MTEKREPKTEDRRPADDLEVPEEVAEEVKGGQSSNKFTSKVTYSKIK